MSNFIILLSKTSILLFPAYPIATPQGFILPFEKNVGPFNLLAHFFLLAKDEWVSCKSKNPLESNLLFNY